MFTAAEKQILIIVETKEKNTDTNIYGIDTIVSGIRRAKDRTKNDDSLTFQIADMQDFIKKTKEKYDFIISMDSLYLLGNNFDSLITNCIKKINKGSRLLIFYSTWEPKNTEFNYNTTKIGHFLVTQNIKFEYFDYSEDDYIHWKKKKEFLENNESAFVKEGNKFLHVRRYMEAKYFASLSEQKAMNRYLYVITN